MDKKTKWSHRFKNENFLNLKETSYKDPRDVLAYEISSRSNNFKVVKMMRKISTKWPIFLWEFNMDKKTNWSHRFKNENFLNLKETSKEDPRDVLAYKISSKSNNFKVVKIMGEKLCKKKKKMKIPLVGRKMAIF